jgi:hypothetical protein
MLIIFLRELWYIYSNQHREYLKEYLSAGTEYKGTKELVFELELKDLMIKLKLKDLLPTPWIYMPSFVVIVCLSIFSYS